MKKVITYGTFDFLHYGHRRLLERAKELGDYLIVGITSSDFDKLRGKINVQQSLMERVQAVKETGLADEIIIEEYEGQKIDDIIKYGVDIFTVGSDWEGYFDYLKEYCEVVYLPRTDGISSSKLRSEKNGIKLGLVGDSNLLNKVIKESQLTNGIMNNIVYDIDNSFDRSLFPDMLVVDSYEELLNNCDAIYIATHPKLHYEYIKKAIEKNKHVLCESPISLSKKEAEELYELAKEKKCILMESIKTAYSTAYLRMLLLIKTGVIGKVVSVDAVCTSLKQITDNLVDTKWNSICAWGTIAMLPIFQILGTEYSSKNMVTWKSEKNHDFDFFTKIDFIYNNAVGSIKVGKGVKSEGCLIITGTNGYIYVPSPWWIMDYFEVRYENSTNNRRYFYQLEGEGIRNELVSFLRAINGASSYVKIKKNETLEFCQVIEDLEKDAINIIV